MPTKLKNDYFFPGIFCKSKELFFKNNLLLKHVLCMSNADKYFGTFSLYSHELDQSDKSDPIPSTLTEFTLRNAQLQM